MSNRSDSRSIKFELLVDGSDRKLFRSNQTLLSTVSHSNVIDAPHECVDMFGGKVKDLSNPVNCCSSNTDQLLSYRLRIAH